GAGGEERAQGVAAVKGVRGGGESFDDVVGVRALGPLIRVSPEAQLEMEAAPRGFVADEAEHLQIAVALGVGERVGANVVARHGEKKGIGEMEVAIADAGGEIVSDAEGQV